MNDHNSLATGQPVGHGFRTIPKGSAANNLMAYVERSTGTRSWVRWAWQGTILTLLYRIPTIWATALRGKLYRLVLQHIGSSCLIEEDVRLQVPARIWLGDRVFIGQYSYIDANTSSVRLGNDVHLGRFATIRGGERGVTVHDGVSINRFTFLDGNGGLEIGRDTLIAPGVQILSGNHQFADRNIPIRFQGTAYGPVSIGEDCWLGANVVVLPGISIGRGAVVAAGAVVTHDIPAYAIAMGIPARVTGTRGEPQES